MIFLLRSSLFIPHGPWASVAWVYFACSSPVKCWPGAVLLPGSRRCLVSYPSAPGASPGLVPYFFWMLSGKVFPRSLQLLGEHVGRRRWPSIPHTPGNIDPAPSWAQPGTGLARVFRDEKCWRKNSWDRACLSPCLLERQANSCLLVWCSGVL